jgi:hypothetical protein
VTVDHILAREFGGSDTWTNLMSLCASHAAEKNHRGAEEGKRRKRERIGKTDDQTSYVSRHSKLVMRRWRISRALASGSCRSFRGATSLAHGGTGIPT